MQCKNRQMTSQINMVSSADAVFARWHYDQGDFHHRDRLYSTVSPSKLSLPFFWLPPLMCKNRTSVSLSICLWDILRRIKKAEGGLNLIIFIYFIMFHFWKWYLPQVAQELCLVLSKWTFPCSVHFSLGLKGKKMGRKPVRDAVVTPFIIFHWGTLFSWQFQTVLDTAIFGRLNP